MWERSCEAALHCPAAARQPDPKKFGYTFDQYRCDQLFTSGSTRTVALKGDKATLLRLPHERRRLLELAGMDA